jgi:hypothetical protein
VATITTPDFVNFSLQVSTVGISEAGVLALTPPTISSTGVLTGSGFRIQFSGPIGQDYTIQASTNLTIWTNISSGTISSSPVTFTDSAATNSPKRFYRIIVP